MTRALALALAVWAPASLASAQDRASDPPQVVAEDETLLTTHREVPELDGRDAPGPDAGDVLIWIPRILFSPITLIDGIQTAFLGASSAFPGGQGPSSAEGAVYVLVTLGLIAACYGLLIRRYRKVGL